ncbi:TatD family hydrolase [Nanoarchaeota archaeon]
MNLLIDAHAHLDDKAFESDLDQVIDNAKAAGVKAIICCGLNAESNKKILELSKQYDLIKPAFGVYPIDTKELTQEQEKEFFDFVLENKPIAIGEVGLDYHWEKDQANKEKQKEFFKKAIEFAEKNNLPMSIHSRNAEEDTIQILESANLKNIKNKIIMHCFGGNSSQTKKVIENGWSFSVPTNIVRSQHFQNIVKQAPITQILTETDCPYLAPEKDQRNEPAFVAKSIKKIAEIKGMTKEDATNNIFMNYQRIF